MLACRQATKLISQAQDRRLVLKESVALRMHLLMCGACPNYHRQMRFIRQACRRIGGGE